MSATDLIDILDDLRDDEFKRFKWFLDKEVVGNIPPIKVNQLSKAEREEAVNLMVQKYEFSGAVKVMESILKKMSRNDLVKELSHISSGAKGPGPGPAGPQDVPAEKTLNSVRTEFINRASGPVLCQLLDILLGQGVITDAEMESARSLNLRADKARQVIDTVRRKGGAASSALVAALCELDPFLSKELNLM